MKKRLFLGLGITLAVAVASVAIEKQAVKGYQAIQKAAQTQVAPVTQAAPDVALGGVQAVLEKAEVNPVAEKVTTTQDSLNTDTGIIALMNSEKKTIANYPNPFNTAEEVLVMKTLGVVDKADDFSVKTATSTFDGGKYNGATSVVNQVATKATLATPSPVFSDGASFNLGSSTNRTA